MLSGTTSAITSQNTKSWQWLSDTNSSAVATGDVDGDSAIEIVTGGYFNDGTHYSSQLVVWNSATLAVENIFYWSWLGDTQVASVAVGDVDGDSQVEIVTGGSFFDGTRWNSQLVVFNGATLAVENIFYWSWLGDTQVASVAVGDVDGDSQVEIVTGGSFFDGTRWNSQLVVFNGATLAVENIFYWYYASNTYVASVAVGDVDGDSQVEIVTGGATLVSPSWNSQLVVFNGATLAVKNIQAWSWLGDTQVASVAVGDVDGDSQVEIVTGGSFFDGTRWNSQLVLWAGATLAVKNTQTWYWTGNTTIASIAVGNISGGAGLNIITAGSYYDGVRKNSQLMIWSGTTLTLNSNAAWFWISDTNVNSVAVSNLGAGNRIITSGAYYDLSQSNAQLTIWG